mgnify:CR=1 FL=1
MTIAKNATASDAADCQRLAEKGDALAQIILGLLYEYGQGVKQDYKHAVSWYQKAAEQGRESAQHELGFMYDNARGVIQDYVMAYVYLAAEQGEQDVRINREHAVNKMTATQIETAQSLVKQLMTTH